MISIYNSVSNVKSDKNDIIGFGKTIIIEGFEGYTGNNTIEYTLKAVLDELPAVSYSTSWDLSPLAKIDKFVKDYSSKDLIDAFASISTSDLYNTPVATDEWTQLFPKDGSTVKFDIKFTAFYKSMLNTSSYFKIIKKIYEGLSPVYHSPTDYLDIIATGIRSAESFGSGYRSYVDPSATGLDGLKADFIGKDGKTIFSPIANIVKMAFSDDDADTSHQKIKESLKQAQAALLSFFTIVEQAVLQSENTGGLHRYRITIPHVINNRKLTADSPTVPWYFYITNFTFSPSVNTVMYTIKNKDKVLTQEVPISVDFNITFESDRVLTNSDLNAALAI